ncbi:MAG TPA: alginate lyase family protein [Polyangiaceae bacterium]
MARPGLPVMPASVLAPAGIDSVRARAAEYQRGRFTYLNDSYRFPVDRATGRVSVNWVPPGSSPLWRYQIQYLGAVLDLVLAGSSDAAASLLESWIVRHASTWDATAWHPYPVSVRLTNICLAAGAAGSFDALGSGAAHLAALSAAYVHHHLERDVRGNHLLDNARALLVAARSLDGPPVAAWERTARQILSEEIPEQVLPDGAHFELAPMYHVVVLWRLVELSALLGPGDPLVVSTLAPAVATMRRFLAGILCPDGEVPLLGDSARHCDFAPPAQSLLGQEPLVHGYGVRRYDNAGLYVFAAPHLWAVFDAGRVCPAYLPAHGHADSLTVEVWCDGACVVGDPGVHSFTGPERAWGRSSRAHSTLTVDDADTSEVYDSFRIGGRATLSGVEATHDQVAATLLPWGTSARLSRTVGFDGPDRNSIHIEDVAIAPHGSVVRSRLHLHPSVVIAARSAGERHVLAKTANGQVRITASCPLRLERGRASREFGLIEATTILVQDLQPEGAGRHLRGAWTIEPLGPSDGHP